MSGTPSSSRDLRSLAGVAGASLFAVALCGLCLGFLGAFHWFLDLFAHFRIQYAVALVLATILALFGRRVPVAIIAGALALLLIADLSSYYFGGRQANENGHALKTVSFNVNTANLNREEALKQIRTENADFVFLMEVNADWIGALKPLETLYPHRIYKPSPGNFGLAFFSKWPIEESELLLLSDFGIPTLLARMRIDEHRLTLIGTHPQPPIGGARSADRNRQLKRLSDYVKDSRDAPLLVVGDFNATPWSYVMKDFVDETGLQYAFQGRGISPTWLRRFPMFAIPIDHMLGNDEIVFHDSWVGENLGSDHSLIGAEFTIRQDT